MIAHTRLYIALGVRHLARSLECVVLAVLMIFGALALEIWRVLGCFYTALVAAAVSRRVRALIVFTILLALPFLFLETSHIWAVPGRSIPLRIAAAPVTVPQEEAPEVAFTFEGSEAPFDGITNAAVAESQPEIRPNPIESLEWDLDEEDEPEPVSLASNETMVLEVETERPEFAFEDDASPALPVPSEPSDEQEETLPLAWEGMVEWGRRR